MRYALPFLLVLAGCGGGTSDVTTPHGLAHQVSCGGPFSSQLDCNMMAQQMCPAGFNPISSAPGTLIFTCADRPLPATKPL